MWYFFPPCVTIIFYYFNSERFICPRTIWKMNQLNINWFQIIWTQHSHRKSRLSRIKWKIPFSVLWMVFYLNLIYVCQTLMKMIYDDWSAQDTPLWIRQIVFDIPESPQKKNEKKYIFLKSLWKWNKKPNINKWERNPKKQIVVLLFNRPPLLSRFIKTILIPIKLS